jgi:general secretion pathway protein G
MKLNILLLSIILTILFEVNDTTRVHIEDREHRIVEIYIMFLAVAIDNFQEDTGKFPRMEEGLSVLVHPPKNNTKWKEPYISQEKFDAWGKKDIWGTEYIYIYPAKYGNLAYDLYSCGKNKKDDFGQGDDITSWKEINFDYYDDSRADTENLIIITFIVVIFLIILVWLSWKRKKGPSS